MGSHEQATIYQDQEDYKGLSKIKKANFMQPKVHLKIGFEEFTFLLLFNSIELNEKP